MEHLELTRMMFITALIRMRGLWIPKFTKKKLHDKLKRTVQVKRMRKIRRKKKHV
jgi:hypothetical protein